MNREDASVLHRLVPYLGVNSDDRDRVEAELSARFACMEDLLFASRQSLAEVGIPEGGFVLLRLILPAARAARRGRYLRERPVCDTEEKLGKIFCTLLRQKHCHRSGYASCTQNNNILIFYQNAIKMFPRAFG